MTDGQQETEEQIFEAARRVFQRKGYAGARMQEIADEANINKSMLHYYYRSKDKLFQKVFQEGMKQFFPVIFEILNKDIAFDEKVGKLVVSYIQFFRENPYLPRFVIHEMNQHPERFKQFVKTIGIRDVGLRFKKQIKEQIKAGNIRQVSPEQIIVNIVGLCVFPFLAQTMVQTVLEMDDKAFGKFLDEREKELSQFILNGLKDN